MATTPTPGDDTITGTPGDDVIDAQGGNDDVFGGDGNDTLDGGDGNDTIEGQDGDDILRISGIGTDTAHGGIGVDTLELDYADATFFITTRNQGSGSTGLSGQFVDGSLSPTRTANYSGIERFVITTGSGGDFIRTGAGNDIVSTGSNNDFVDVSSGDDRADGGAGDDYLVADLSAATGPIIFDLIANSYSGPIGSFTNFEAFGDGQVGRAGLATGSGDDEIVTGDRVNSSEDTVRTGAGNDQITVFTGRDTVDGGAGSDLLIVRYTAPGFGSVTFGVNSGQTTPDFGTLDAGYNGRYDDTATNSRVDYTGIERFDIRVGDGRSATIRTGRGNDEIVTGDGADFIAPSGGNDYIDAGAGRDVLDYAQGLTSFEQGAVGVIVNLSTANIVAPTGHALAGTVVRPNTGIDNFGDRDEINGIEDVNTGAANDWLVGSSGQNSLNAGGGDDLVDGGAGGDMLNGGDGVDTLDYRNEGGTLGVIVNISTNFIASTQGRPNAPASVGFGQALDSQNQVETLSNFENVFTGGLADRVIGNDGRNVIDTGAGDDRLEGRGGDDELLGGLGNDFLDGGAGVDTMVGGMGDDIYVVDTAADIVTESAGEGRDQIQTALASYSLAGLANVENLTGTGNFDQTLTGNALNNLINGGLGADVMAGGLGDDSYLVDNAGDVVTEQAGEGAIDTVLTTLSSYTLGANLETLVGLLNTGQTLRGNGVNNSLNGGAGNDYIDASDGGTDGAYGNAGDDAFFFGAALTAGDTVQGGAGMNDQLGLRGDYSAGLTLGAATISGVEVISVLAGFDYRLATNDANVAAGDLLTIYGGGLGAGDDLTFDGSAETNGAFRVFGGAGVNAITTGAGDDGVYFGPGLYGVDDTIDFGAGANDQLGLDSDFTGTLGANLAGVDVIALFRGPDGDLNNYAITATDGLVASGAVLTLYGATVTTGIRFNGSQETDGSFRLLGGQVGDFLIGGAGADVFFGGLGGDEMRGGAGADVFIYDDVLQSTSDAADTLLDFGPGEDRIDLSGIDAITTNGAGDDAFTFIGSGAFTAAGQLRVQDGQSGRFLEGDVDGDGVADFVIAFDPGAAFPIGPGDFVL